MRGISSTMRGLSSAPAQITALCVQDRDMGWSSRVIWALLGALAAAAVIAIAALAGTGGEIPSLGDRVDLDDDTPSVVSTQTATSTATSSPVDSSSPGSSVVAPSRAPVRIPVVPTCDDDDCDDDDDHDDDDDD